MTADELKAIDEIRGTAGFRTIEFYLNKMVYDLNTVEDLDGTSQISVGIQALAKKKAVKIMKEFLVEIKLSVPKTEERRTFE